MELPISGVIGGRMMEKEKQAFDKWHDSTEPDDNEIDFSRLVAEEHKDLVTQDWAYGFYGGYHSRDEEIAALKAEIKRKDKRIKEAMKLMNEDINDWDNYWYKLRQALQGEEE
jgi:hypothetical protein